MNLQKRIVLKNLGGNRSYKCYNEAKELQDRRSIQSYEGKSRKGAFNNKIFLEYVDEEKQNFKEEKELNKKFRKKKNNESINRNK